MDRKIADAIEVFVRAFAMGRSMTHPFQVDWIDGVWALRDAPRKRIQDYRKEEWVAFRRPPEDVHRIASATTRGKYAICAIRSLDQTVDSVRDAYKSLGYRFILTEPLFMQALKRIPKFDVPVEIQRVTTQEVAYRLAKAARSRQVLPEHLKKDSPIRQYVAIENNQLVGWVKSVTIGNRTWCSNMYVVPKHRRRGIARSLMSRMLIDDRKARAECAVLLASHTGAKLYPVVGYEMIGELLLFTPKRS